MTAKEHLHELVEEMSDAEAREWVQRVSVAVAASAANGSPTSIRRGSDNAELLRLFNEWRQHDGQSSEPPQTVEFDPLNIPPVRFRQSLREMGLPEDGWD